MSARTDAVAWRAWSEEETEYLCEHFGRRTYAQIGQALTRPARSVMRRALRIGLSSGRRRRPQRSTRADTWWSSTEDDFLRAHYGPMTAAEVGLALGRSQYSVIQRSRRLGESPSRRPWTDEEESLFIRQFGRVPVEELAAALSRTVTALYRKAGQLGVSARCRLSMDAQELLWQMRDDADAVSFFAEHFSLRTALVTRMLADMRENGGPLTESAAA